MGCEDTQYIKEITEVKVHNISGDKEYSCKVDTFKVVSTSDIRKTYTISKELVNTEYITKCKTKVRHNCFHGKHVIGRTCTYKCICER